MISDKKTITGFALLLTIVALITYAFIALLGLEYLLRGFHAVVFPLIVGGLAALSYCIYVMCKSKASRDKRTGLPREVLSIAGAGVLLFAGSIPFTQFLYVHDHREALVADMLTTVSEVGTIDSAYLQYADRRIAAYKRLLKKEKFGKLKQQCLVTSLQRRLLPSNREEVSAERQEWLHSIGTPNVWSIATPRNLSRIIEAGEEWTKQYTIVSAIVYKGENEEPFATLTEDSEEKETGNKTASLKRFFKRQRPDYRSLLIATGCCLLILTTYFHIRRPKNRYERRFAPNE